ncbi:MAG TPA: hemerythrin domain-containing protein [Steroidobacteraceae bacterium]|nr:hemerythrin domain-containing protein [Steroidobacteraceae bacterium]
MDTSGARDHRPGDPILTPAGETTAVNAIELLKSGHRQVEDWLGQFAATDDAAAMQALAADICTALEVHMRIEEEVFYPAFLAAGGNTAMHHEALVEHAAARRLVEAIRSCGGAAADDYFAARMRVLAAMICRHIREEEETGGMFAIAAGLELDLDGLGANLEQLKVRLMDEAGTDRGYDAAAGSPDEGEEITPEFEDPAADGRAGDPG